MRDAGAADPAADCDQRFDDQMEAVSVATRDDRTRVGVASAVAHVADGGVPLNAASQVLGHSGISITADVYGHIAPDVSRNALTSSIAALTATSGTTSGDRQER